MKGQSSALGGVFLRSLPECQGWNKLMGSLSFSHALFWGRSWAMFDRTLCRSSVELFPGGVQVGLLFPHTYRMCRLSLHVQRSAVVRNSAGCVTPQCTQRQTPATQQSCRWGQLLSRVAQKALAADGDCRHIQLG